MSRKYSRDSRSVSEYPPAYHSPVPSFAAFAITALVALTVVAVVTYPVVTFALATAFVGLLAAVRVAVAHVERESVEVHLPALPVRVTVSRTAGE